MTQAMGLQVLQILRKYGVVASDSYDIRQVIHSLYL